MDGAGFARAGEIIGRAMIVGGVMLAISAPLAIWKIIDIAIWFCGHVSINWQ